jgi:alpha-mannosidase
MAARSTAKPARKRVHLVCNAHLDPVWLWHWEDGLTEALSTYRVAADFCERYPEFVFNHNEVLLYRWAQEYEPQLFERIRRLVRKGQWEIAGGAYLQPDVNNTSGESHIRQFLLGREYFEKTFGVYPRTAYNFDPFGHGEGFPQILAGCGMERYVFCRPDWGTYDLPTGPFTWRDRSGHEVVARRSHDHYLTNAKFAEWGPDRLDRFGDEPVSMILWGIGNHGGGPSHDEYRQIRQYAKQHPELELIHSTIDGFFDDVLGELDELPVVQSEIQNSFPGCYTSMSRVKRGHREAESLMASAERLATLAWWWGTAPYPEKALEIAWRDILFTEFHDILPGSGVPTVERDSVQMLNHAKEILRRERMRSLHSLICRDADGGQNEVPVFVANPHGFAVKKQIEFELQLNGNAWAVSNPEVRLRGANGRDVPCQRLLAEANCAGNWRVRLATTVDLKPWEILRFDEYYVNDKGKAARLPKVSARSLSFRTKSFSLRINPRTGLVDHLSAPGARTSLVGKGAFQPTCWADMDHSWTSGSPAQAESHRVGAVSPPWDRAPAARFTLATKEEAAALSPPPADKWMPGRSTVAQPIHIVEHGDQRTVVEAVFTCGASALVRQYVIGHTDGTLELRDRLFNNHRDTMIKLLVPTDFEAIDSVAETLYSAATRLPTERHEEHTQQRWAAVRGTQAGKPVHLAVLNSGSFGYSHTGRELALNVVRSPAYSSFNLDPKDPRANARFVPRQDQGEHEVAWQVLVGGRFSETRVSRAAQVFSTPPVWQVYYPQPDKVDRRRRAQVQETVTVDDAHVQVVALKKAHTGNRLIVRLQNTSATSRQVTLRVKPFRGSAKVTIEPYGLATVAVRKGGTSLKATPVDLVERRLR